MVPDIEYQFQMICLKAISYWEETKYGMDGRIDMGKT